MKGEAPRHRLAGGLARACHVLGKARHQATGWAAEGSGAILTLHVPDDVRDKYLTCDDSCYLCHGNESGLIKPLPAWMITDIESV